MARILILTDRPEADDQIVARAFDLVHHLQTGEVSVVVTRKDIGFVAAGCSFGIPDSGLLSSDSSATWVVSPNQNEVAIATQFLLRCRNLAAESGLTCETARSDSYFMSTAMVLTNVVGLVVVSRAIFTDDSTKCAAMRSLWHNVGRPWIVYPEIVEPWKRVVIAVRKESRRDELIAWGRHWSERFNVPLASIEIQSKPSQPIWKVFTRWLTRKSVRQNRDAIQQALSRILGPHDLLLVDRDPAIWPDTASGLEVSLDDLVAYAPCTIGIAPTSSNAHTIELLYPHGLVDGEDFNVEVVAA